MKFVYPGISRVFKFDGTNASELIIENRRMLCELLNDITRQIDGIHGEAVLSISDTPVEFGKHVEIIDRFVPFELNTKSLQTCLCKAMEKEAVSDEFFSETGDLLTHTERYLDSLCFDYPCEVTFQKLSVGAIIKAASPGFEAKSEYVLENVFDYMSLVREFSGDKLFITVNLRCFFDDKEVQSFVDTAISHDFKLLMLESSERKALENTVRVIIDDDLCEI